MSDIPDLKSLLERVQDEESLLAFVSALADDFARERTLDAGTPPGPYRSGSLGWENGTVDAFLDSAAAWGRATMRRAPRPADPNPWRRCARILHAGKSYE